MFSSICHNKKIVLIETLRENFSKFSRHVYVSVEVRQYFLILPVRHPQAKNRQNWIFRNNCDDSPLWTSQQRSVSQPKGKDSLKIEKRSLAADIPIKIRQNTICKAVAILNYPRGVKLRSKHFWKLIRNPTKWNLLLLSLKMSKTVRFVTKSINFFYYSFVLLELCILFLQFSSNNKCIIIMVTNAPEELESIDNWLAFVCIFSEISHINGKCE